MKNEESFLFRFLGGPCLPLLEGEWRLWRRGGALFIFLYSFFILHSSLTMAATIVATVNGNPITDVDITERTKIIPPALNNRDAAKNAIIDDYIKLEYAKSMKIEPSEKEVAAAIKEHKDNPQMRLYARATLSWQIMIMRALVPSISVSESDLDMEMADLERAHGLPLDVTFLRLIDVPKEIYDKLGKPNSCIDAENMAKKLGGAPQKINALEYELAPEVREHFIGLEVFAWSPLTEGRTFLICDKKKTKEWGQLDDIIKQNAIYKRALFQADQLLKQLRRRAAIT
ncbi:MAG: SurA N-terminal domain-containing protein [Rickettsiales bacterium]|jgi:hypothetical protein|nr:SurA N-terminal domain-containing protein [Rickettsiales bacterium]